MKRKLELLLTAVLAAASLSGCAGNFARETAPSELSAAPSAELSTAETESGGELTGEEITLTIWHIASDESRRKCITNSINRFMEKYPNIKVVDVANENDPYKTKLATAMAAGQEPDIFVTWGGGWLKSFIDEGKVLDIDGWIGEIADDYYESALSLFHINNKNYALPYSCGPSPVYYNKMIYAQLGLEPPASLAELESNCEKIKEAGYTPFALGNASQWPGALAFVSLSLRYGGKDAFLNAYHRTNGGTFADESFIKAGEKIQEWVQRDFYQAGYNGTNYDTGGSRMLFYSGQAAHIIQTNGMFTNCRTEAPDFYENNLGVFSFPLIDGGKGTDQEILGGGNGYSISSSCKYPREAFELIKMLTDAEFGQDSVDISGMISGVKGVVINNPLQLKQLDLITNATYIQNYYDQFLPSELGSLHKQTTYDLFGLTITPEQAAADMEALAQRLLVE